MKSDLSYHDVTVYVGNVAYKISDNYALQLHCTRAGGWQLWKVWDGKDSLIGGEFDGDPFCIEVAGTVIVGEKPAYVERPQQFGWDGTVIRWTDRYGAVRFAQCPQPSKI
jgi:hypothetical protein